MDVRFRRLRLAPKAFGKKLSGRGPNWDRGKYLDATIAAVPFAISPRRLSELPPLYCVAVSKRVTPAFRLTLSASASAAGLSVLPKRFMIWFLPHEPVPTPSRDTTIPVLPSRVVDASRTLMPLMDLRLVSL